MGEPRIVKLCKQGHHNPTPPEEHESWHQEIGTNFLSECQECGGYVMVEVVATEG